MAQLLLELKGVSKRYSLRPERRLRDATAATLRELCGHSARQGLRDGEFWALSNINLHVYAGEVVGVIGHNGAGKSTLLNLVTQIILPTTGSISLFSDRICRIDQGGVLSAQETGRENIRLQLALYGVPVDETENEIAAIAAFADLQRQLDSPVATYSSGMRSRLGFAIYARLNPDLFLIDEGIGGGDQRFRERFRGFIENYCAEGGSMLFCMHDTNMIQTLCDRVMLLDGGQEVITADPTTAIDAYNSLAAQRGLPELPIRRRRGAINPAPEVTTANSSIPLAPPTSLLDIVDIRVVGADGHQLHAGEPAAIEIDCQLAEGGLSAVCMITISRGEITPLATVAGPTVSITCPGITLRCLIGSLALVPGEYQVRIRLFDTRLKRMIKLMDHSSCSTFRIYEPIKQCQPGQAGRGGLVFLSANWEFLGTSAASSAGQSMSAILRNQEEGMEGHGMES